MPLSFSDGDTFQAALAENGIMTTTSVITSPLDVPPENWSSVNAWWPGYLEGKEDNPNEEEPIHRGADHHSDPGA